MFTKKLLRMIGFMAMAGIAWGTFFITPAIPEVTKKATLDFWHTYSLAEIKVLNEQIERYMQQNPNVTIKLTNIPYEQRATMIINAIKGGAPPDLYRGDMPMQFEIARLNAAYFLEDYLRKNHPQMLTDVPENIWRMCRYEGHIIAIPEDFFVPVIYYNKDLFTRVGIGAFPTTWDSLLDAAKKLHNPSQGKFGVEWMQWGDGPYWSLGALLLSNNGGIIKEDAAIVDNENNVETLNFIKKLYKYTPPGMSTFSYDDWDKAFYLGRVGIQFGNGSWSIGNYRELAPDLNYGIAAYKIVGPSGTDVRVPGHGVCYYMVMNKTKYPELAASVIAWLVNPENHLEWCKKLWHTPVRESTFENSFFNDPRFDAFKFELTHASTEFTGDIATVFNPLIVDIYRKTFWDIVEGDRPTRESLHSAALEMQKVLKELGVE